MAPHNTFACLIIRPLRSYIHLPLLYSHTPFDTTSDDNTFAAND